MAAAGTVLRRLMPADLPAAQALSASFDWPHRIEDWSLMLALGRGIAAERDGALIGTALYWTYGPDKAALGMLTVAPSAQGRGLGRQLAEHVLAALNGRTVLLHATEAGLPLYRRFGFVHAGKARQHQGAAFLDGLMPLREGERLRPIGRSDPPVLARLDLAAGGVPRQPVIEALLKIGTGVVLDRDGEAIGFALLRRFGRGQVIGPVVAPDPAGAKALIGHFLGSHPGQFLRVDVPEAAGLSDWLEELGLKDAGIVFRMVRGSDVQPVGPARGFALISQAFG